MLKVVLLCTVVAVALAHEEFNAYKPEYATVLNDFTNALPDTYVDEASLPATWQWGDINGTSYLTKSLNQHIPQYCGSCWAHGAISSFADRIKIARKGMGPDINPAIQFILNCGTAGSCHGGSHIAVFEFIKKNGFVPFDTCLQYEACSAESSEGLCKGRDWSCTAMNTCRTCSTFSDMGGTCTGLSTFPNATVAEYGHAVGKTAMMKEIYARGPIACSINASPLHEYTGGIYSNALAGRMSNHIVSVVGWGTDKATGEKFWTVRNSWGEYWGEEGYFRVKMGLDILGLESDCAWSTPGQWTEHNFPCYEDGSNCKAKSGTYVDASIKKPWHMQ